MGLMLTIWDEKHPLRSTNSNGGDCHVNKCTRSQNILFQNYYQNSFWKERMVQHQDQEPGIESEMMINEGLAANPKAFPGGTSGQGSPCQYRRRKRCGLDPWVGKGPWRRKWPPTRVLLPGKNLMDRGGLQGKQFTGLQRVRNDWAMQKSIRHSKP